MNPVVHFELPADDRERMAKFYSRAFGWKTQMLGPDMNNYVLATTSPEDQNGRPTLPGTINGGFFERKSDMPAQHPMLVISVDDINIAMQQVTAAGGKVLGEPMEIPGVGLYVSFIDTEQNRLCMLQPIRAE